jgi:hypothetical protein
MSGLRSSDWRAVAKRIGTAIVIAWFLCSSLRLIFLGFTYLLPGGDAVLYAKAASAWLTGGDPWHQGVLWGSYNKIIYFGAPPTTLVAYIPFAFMPASVVAAFWMIADACSVVLIVRHLRYPLWWCFFPPAVEATMMGNPDPVMLALLLIGGGRLAAFAPLLKPYAVAALIAERRWRTIAVTATLGCAVAAFLPWGTFLKDATFIRDALVAQNYADISAFGQPYLLPFALFGLCMLGWRRAWWLATPVLWPASQYHYAVMAMPALSPLLGLGLALQFQGSAAMTVFLVGYLIWARKAAHFVVERMAARTAGSRSDMPHGPVLAPSTGSGNHGAGTMVSTATGGQSDGLRRRVRGPVSMLRIGWRARIRT